jgi:hypothetical protein
VGSYYQSGGDTGDPLVWSALEHGVVGDGVTDETQAIKTFLQDASSAGAVAHFPMRDYVSSWFYADITPRIEAAWGARILCSQTNDSWNFGNSSTPSTVALTGNADAGTRVLAVSTTGISADDVIFVGDTATMVGGSTSTLNVPAKNMYRVESVDSSVQLTLAEPIHYDLTTANSAYIAKPTIRRRGWIRGLHFESTAGQGSGVTASFLRLYRCRDLDVDVTAHGFSNAGLILQDCYNFNVRARCTNFADVAKTGVTGQFGYGVDVSGASAHGHVDVIADRTRHAVTFVGTGHAVRVTGVSNDATSGHWDAHAGFTDVVFDNCVSRGGGVGSSGGRAYNIRGRRQHVQGGIADQTNGGVYLFDVPRDCTVKGLTVSRTINGGHGVEMGDPVDGVTVSGCDFSDLAGNGVWTNFTHTFANVRIMGNAFRDVTGAVIEGQTGGSQSVWSRWRIVDNIAEDTGGATTTKFIDYAGSTSDVLVEGNHVTDDLP